MTRETGSGQSDSGGASFLSAPKPEQLPLSFPWSAGELERHLKELTGLRVRLTLTDNTSTMLSAVRSDGLLKVRMQRLFAVAGAEVLAEIADVLTGREKSSPLLRDFIRRMRPDLPSGRPRKTAVDPVGACYDLAEIFDRLNRKYFGGALSCPVTWAGRVSRRRVRRRTLGSYSSRTGAIRISPLLDRKSVPLFFLEFVLYHEMLHAAMGVPTGGARRSIHSREFRVRERLFREFGRATEWERGRNF